MTRLIVFILPILLLFSCGKDTESIEVDISKIKIETTIERFDSLFANAAPNDLPKLKQTYPFMFSKQYKDSFWIAKLSDTLQQELSQEIQLNITDFDAIEAEIEDLYKHLKYYYPEFHAPRVISAISYVDYRNKTIVTDTIALLSIDTYLGADNAIYDGIQEYIRTTFEQDQIVVDLANEYANKYILRGNARTLLDEMIFHGKKLYFKDKVIPFKTDAEKISYTEEELHWAMANEEQIWRYFVDRELLYSTDSKLPSRFINPAPFTKFNLVEIDNESPARLGRYIGWQIVRAYAENNPEVSFKDLLNKTSEDIFNNSHFKPKR